MMQHLELSHEKFVELPNQFNHLSRITLDRPIKNGDKLVIQILSSNSNDQQQVVEREMHYILNQLQNEMAFQTNIVMLNFNVYAKNIKVKFISAVNNKTEKAFLFFNWI